MRLILAGLIAIAAQSEVALANEPAATRCLYQLQLRVRGEQTRVSNNVPLALAIEIANVSNEPVFMYGDLSYGVWLWLYDSSGKEVPTAFIVEHLPPPPPVSDYLKLRPAHSLVLHDTYSQKQLRLQPGRYSAKIEYHLLHATPDLGAPVCSGTLGTADKVTFEVVE